MCNSIYTDIFYMVPYMYCTFNNNFVWSLLSFKRSFLNVFLYSFILFSNKWLVPCKKENVKTKAAAKLIFERKNYEFTNVPQSWR